METYDKINCRTKYKYDELGRMIVAERTSADGENLRSVKYYDAGGNVVRERIKCNKTDDTETYREIRFEYDSMSRPTATIANDGTRDVYTQYSYDSMGRVKRYVNGGTERFAENAEIPETAPVTYYEYDRFGNVIKETDSDGMSRTAEYDLWGNVKKSTDKNGITTVYSYNAYGSPKTITTDGADVISYTYNANNMLTGESAGAIVKGYEYDPMGRLTKETEGDKVKAYTYDTVGNRTSADIEGISASYTYDHCNRLTEVSIDGGGITYSYDAAGRLVGEVRADGGTTEYEYDGFGRLTEKRNVNGDKSDIYALTYYADGNIASKTVNGAVTEYEYDEMGRLTRENGTRYTYDTRGNRVSMTTDTGTTLYEYDRNNRLTNENRDGILISYDYDAEGNLISKATGRISEQDGAEELILSAMTGTSETLDGSELTVYSYDTRNRLVGVESDNGMTASYSYGVDNMRRSKTVNGVTTRHIWDNGNIVGESDESGKLTAKYYYGNTIFAADTGDGVEYYQSDSHGDISEYSGNTYTYDAFGNRETESAENVNPFGYCGEYCDRETGMIYLRNRYYDPSMGRFISEDPARDGLNWYAYCNGNPVMFIDPWGLAPTPQQAAAMAEHIYNYDMSHSQEKRTVEDWRLITVWEGREGLKMGFYIPSDDDWQNPSEYTIVFKGTTWYDLEDWKNNAEQLLSPKSADMWDAINYSKGFVNNHSQEITFGGHISVTSFMNGQLDKTWMADTIPNFAEDVFNQLFFNRRFTRAAAKNDVTWEALYGSPGERYKTKGLFYAKTSGVSK